MTASSGGIAGLVLAGGRSRRMGGDKALVMLGGVPLLQHVLRRLVPQCARVLISANGDPERLRAFGHPVVADDVTGFAGPLAGILAGLDRAATRSDIDAVVSISVDTPFLPPDLVTRLREAAAREGRGLACAVSAGKPHPVAALWPVAVRHGIRRALVAEGQRRVSALQARHGCARAEWPMDPIDPFFNINTPEDLAAAQALMSRDK